MGRDLNKVQVIGRLGGTPEGRYTQDGRFVCTFSVASGRQWTDRSGQRQEETEWFKVVAWEKLGEVCNQYLEKGTRCYVEGRLQTRKYTDRDGNDRYVVEVIASDMIILDSRRPSLADAEADAADGEVFPDEPAPAPAPAPVPAAPAATRAPARAAARTSAPNAPRRNVPQPIESDDEVPF